MEKYKVTYQGKEIEIERLPNGKFKMPPLGQFTKQGLGSVWLDEGRIPYESVDDKLSSAPAGKVSYTSESWGQQAGLKKDLQDKREANCQGRFPANLLASDDALNDGRVSKSTGGSGTGKLGKRIYGKFENEMLAANTGGCGDSGSFSRYFSLDSWFAKKLAELPKGVQRTFPFLIVPKASKSEKDKGCEGLPLHEPRYGKNFSSSDKGTISSSKKPSRNNHPTCKPIKLMSYLITLGSRPGDVVLDPFIGSGTTAIAARMLRRHYIGYETDSDYCKIAEARLSAVQERLI